jgi:hypothetical protein
LYSVCVQYLVFFLITGGILQAVYYKGYVGVPCVGGVVGLPGALHTFMYHVEGRSAMSTNTNVPAVKQK